MNEITIKDVFTEFLRRNKDIYPTVTVEQMVDYDMKNGNASSKFECWKTRWEEIDSCDGECVGIDDLTQWLQEVKEEGAEEIEVLNEELRAMGRKKNTIGDILSLYNCILIDIAEKCITTDEMVEIKKLEAEITEARQKLNLLWANRQAKLDELKNKK